MLLGFRWHLLYLVSDCVFVCTISCSSMLVDLVFTRLYLIARSVTLHSPLVNAASSRTIGYLNRVPMTISFVLRAFLQTYPAGCWSCVMLTTLFIASWSMHACEKGMWIPIHSTPLRTNASSSTFINATWLTIVTFTTVGQFFSSISVSFMLMWNCFRIR